MSLLVGTIISCPSSLRTKRLESLSEKLVIGQTATIAGDHQLDRDYFSAVCR